MFLIVMYWKYLYLQLFSLILLISCNSIQKAKDNGDIYIVKEETFIEDIKTKMQTESPLVADINTTSTTSFSNIINFDDIISLCNSSFSIPMHYLIAFNTTAELPDLIDKTGMLNNNLVNTYINNMNVTKCFIRCFFEKSGLIENWKLNVLKIRENIWPATGDTIGVCEKQSAGNPNACVRTYAIAKCLILRSIVDAQMPV